MAMNGNQNGSQNGIRNNGPADTARDQQLDAAYRAAGRDGPPAALDDAIRAAARRAVGARPGMPGRSSSRWRLPLSVAAVLVLSVSLVTLMREEGHDRLPAGDSLSVQVTQPAAAPAATPAQDRGEPAALPQGDAPQRTTPQSGTPQSAAPPAASPAVSSPQRQAVAPPVSSATPAPPPGAEKRARFEAAPVAEGATAATAGTPALVERAASLAPAPQAFAPFLPDRDVDAQNTLRRRSAEASARDDRAPAAALAERAQTRRLLRSAPPSTASAALGSPARLWADLADAPATDWLMRIRELRGAGRDADADAMLVEFRRRFPEAALPEDLLPENTR